MVFKVSPFVYVQRIVGLPVARTGHGQVRNRLMNDLTRQHVPVSDTLLKLFNTMCDHPLEYDVIKTRLEPHDRSLVDEILIPLHFFISEQQSKNILFYPQRVDIETVRHCNAACVFCPQSIQRKPYGVMSWKIFKKIIDRLEGYQPDWITFNHYGDPLLDPLFKERLNLLYTRGHRAFLFTNAICLNEDLIGFLDEKYFNGIVFNFPSLDPREWADMMGVSINLYQTTQQAIVWVIKKLSGQINELGIVVNGVTNNHDQRVTEIERFFKPFGDVFVSKRLSDSRAGNITAPTVQSAKKSDKRFFCGCQESLNHMYVSWEGKWYLCCQDYDQKIILGDCMSQSIEEIMVDKKVRQLQEEIWGLQPMRSELICRKCNILRADRVETVITK